MVMNIGKLVLERRKAKEIFGIKEDINLNDLKSIYRTLARKNHPDGNRNNPEEATRNMAKINHAYEILLNPESEEEKHIRRFYENFII